MGGVLLTKGGVLLAAPYFHLLLFNENK
jgi:hypothetical protein